MLGEQIKALKESRKTIEIARKKQIVFDNTEDLDDDTILDLIPIRTPYTQVKSLNFDRQRLSELQENRFNAKFKCFIKSLLEHQNIKDIEYLYEYLVRRYMIDTFNTRELVFILLPQPRFYKLIFLLSKTTSFKYFADQPTFSTYYIANLCLRDLYFFDFFVEYFDYFEYVKEFVNKILEILAVNIRTKKYSSQLYDIMEKLIEKSELEYALKVFHMFREVIGEIDDFHNLLNPYFSFDMLNKEAKIKFRPGLEADIVDENVMFSNSIISKQDREFLSNYDLLVRFVMWLDKTGLKSETISYLEILAVKYVYNYHSSNKHKFTFSTCEENLLNNELSSRNTQIDLSQELITIISVVDKKAGFIEYFAKTYTNFIGKLIAILDDKNKAYLSKVYFDESLVNEANYKDILLNMAHNCNANMNSEAFMQKDPLLYRLFKVIVDYKALDLMFVKGYVTERLIFCLIDNVISETSVLNTVELCKLTLINIRAHVLSNGKEMEYLSYLIDTQPTETIKSDAGWVWILVQRRPSKQLILQYLSRYNDYLDILLLNDVYKWIVLNQHFTSGMLVFVEIRVEDFAKDILRSILEVQCICDATFFLLQKFRSDEKVIIQLLNSKQHKLLNDLCVLYTCSEIFNVNGVDNNNEVIDDKITSNSVNQVNYCLKDIYEYSKWVTTSDAQVPHDFVQLCLLAGFVDLLNKEKIYNELIYHRSCRNWHEIKKIIMKGLCDHCDSTQAIFDYMVLNSSLFTDDLDLLSQLSSFDIKFDCNKLSCLFEPVCNEDDLNCTKGHDTSTFTAFLFDNIIMNSNFNLLPLLPKIAEVLLKHKKRSLSILFEKHGKLMTPYIKETLLHFPEIQDKMLHLDPRFTLKTTLHLFELEQKDTYLSFISSVLVTDLAISNELLSRTAEVYSRYLNLVNSNHLICLLGSYIRVYNKFTDSILNLLESLYIKAPAKFHDVSLAILPFNTDLFTAFAPSILKILTTVSINETKTNEIRFFTLYISNSTSLDFNCKQMFKRVLRSYLLLPNQDLALCLSSIINYKPKHMRAFNAKILALLKGSHQIKAIELLHILYTHVMGYNQCIKDSASYFALILDSNDQKVSKAARELMKLIREKHGVLIHEILEN